MMQRSSERLDRSAMSGWGRLVAPLAAASALLAGCEAKLEGLKTGEIIRNDSDTASRLVASGPGLLAPETVQLGEGSGPTVQIRTSTGKVYFVELYDGDTSTYTDPRHNRVENPPAIGLATIASTISALEIGTLVQFPTQINGKAVFDTSGRGKLEVDAIVIVPSAEKK